MSSAKGISLFGCVIYLLIFIGGVFFPGQIKEFVSQSSQVSSKTIIAVVIALAFLLSIINFCYFYYLYVAGKKGEEVGSATFLSLQLIILPIMLMVGALVVFAF